MAKATEDTTPNQTTGKFFVGSKGGGRYQTVEQREGEAEPDGSIVCDLFDDGSFVYKFEANHGVSTEVWVRVSR